MNETPCVLHVPTTAPRIAKHATLLAVLAVLVIAYHYGVFAEVSDPKRLANAVLSLGNWGYVGFLVAYTVLQPFGVPGTVFIIAAPLIWPWPTAFLLSMAGTMAASVVGFSFARVVAREWVSDRIPRRLRKYDEALEYNAFRTVFVLRLIFWMPQVLHGFLGVSKVPFWTHFWASFLGYIPPLFTVSYFASEVFDPRGHMQPRAWLVMFGLLVVSAVLAFLLRQRPDKRAD
jgi:uncharacterized membrane protein YdjX (TVP38/TMEM64 family)